MNAKIKISSAIIALLIACPLVMRSQTSLSGYVRDAQTNEPLQGVTFHRIDASVMWDSTVLSVSTDVNGYYSIPGGGWIGSLWATLTNYTPLEQSVSTSTTTLDFYLEPFAPPFFTSTPITSATQGIPYAYTVTADDNNGDQLTYTSLVLPSWLSFNTETQVLAGVPANEDVGDHSVSLSVTDGTFATDQAFTITVADVNDAPVLIDIGDQSTDEGVALTGLTVDFIEVDPGDTHTISVVSDEPNVTVENLSGHTSGSTYDLVPQAEYTGTAQITVTVTDNGTGTLSDSETYTLTVNAVSDAPTVVTHGPSDIYETILVVFGEVSDEGSSPVTDRGMCLSLSPDPDLGDIVSHEGSGPGFFTSQFSYLMHSTTYYYRAFATNASGTSYGEVLMATTMTSDMILTETITNISCFGANDGSIDISVSGGIPPYTYSWSNGETTQNIGSLAPGTYSVNITDSEYDQIADTYEVLEPAEIDLLSSIVNNVTTCNGDATGSIQLVITGGTSPYTIEWEHGPTVAFIPDLTAGTYDVLVTDANNCEQTASFDVLEPDELISIVADISDETCIGCEDGSITAAALGGTPPYTYNWTGPDGYTSVGALGTIAGLSSGDYYLVVSDINGCTSDIMHAYVGNPLVVTNTNDSGEGSLRNAIELANSIPGKNEIRFNIPGQWVHTIAPIGMLPSVVEPLIINGLSQPGSAANTNPPGQGFNTTPLILLDGTSAGDPATGLIIHTDSCIIKGLIINQFSNRGIALWGNNNTVSDCFIGTDSLGNETAGYGNGVFGIEIYDADNNEIRNCLVSLNGGSEPNPGIAIIGESTNNLIAGNLIGTDISGTLAAPNSGSGINIGESPSNIIGGINIEDRNIICGGIHLAGATTIGTKIIGNYLGPDVSGQSALGAGGGIIIAASASSTEIGPGNVISGNAVHGLEIDSTASDNRVFGNYFGLAADGITPMGNNNSNIILANSPNNRIGGLTADSLNVISACNDAGIAMWGSGSYNNQIVGNYIGTDTSGRNAVGNGQQGVLIAAEAKNNIIGPNNVISGNDNWGIQIYHITATNNQIINNLIGTDASGTLPLDNGQAGIFITNSPGNVVDGNTICGGGAGSPGGPGIELLGNDTRNTTISNNYIGTNTNGDQGLGNGSVGIMVFTEASNNFIGPNNVISGNGGGIQIEGEGTDSTSVFGNYIGTNQSNSSEIGNINTGVYVALGARNTVIGPDNVISNNDNGIHIENETTSSTTIIGNFIGTDVAGTTGLGNSNIGVWIGGSPNNVIGGPNVDDRNVISGNASDGILLVGLTAVGNEVYGNYIGTNAAGNTSIKNGSVGIAINNASNSIIGGLDPGEGNLVSDIGIGNSGATGNHIIGNYIGINANGDQALDPGKGNAGVMISDASENVIGPGNVLSGNQEGIYITSLDYINPDSTVHNIVIGNLIGTNAEGTTAIPNQQGILVEGALETTIGGVLNSERNIISGNLHEGIAIRSLNLNTRVVNNYIGSDLTGEIAIPNTTGIKISYPSTETYIGGGVSGYGNLIAFNAEPGIGVDAHQNYIQGNEIYGNGHDGIYVTGNQNTIGGPSVADRNFIYGNNSGIAFFPNSDNNTVEGNFIGTDVTGILDMSDGWNGISIGGSDNTIKQNLISGYQEQGQGILIMRWSPSDSIPRRNRIEQNRIGVALNGEDFLPNGHGISLNSTTDNVIIGNEVAGNLYNGIALRDDQGATSINNLISQNSVYSNGGIGIDLISDGPTPNDLDPLDPDEGPNHLQNFPVLDFISFGEGTVTIRGVLNSEASSTYILEFFSSYTGDPSTYGEGEFYLGCDTVFTDGNGDAFFECTLPTAGNGGEIITATATDEGGNTSEFSQVTDQAHLLVTNTNDSGPGSLRQAIIDANSNPGMDYIQFSIPGDWVHTIRPETLLPSITDPLVINGFSQPGSVMNSNPAGTGFNTEPKIELDGSNSGNPATGLIVIADSCEISGLIVNQYSNRGIALWGNNNNVVECFIGTDSLGNSSLDYGNKVTGIEIESADNNVVHNCIISANGGDEPNPGISIHSGSTLNQITGNLIGTDISGLLATPNSGGGIGIINSSGNTIGGPNIEDRNIIFGGVALAQGVSGTRIIGNYLGLDVTGLDTLGSGGGISMYGGANDNEVGPGNIISGIEGFGIYIIDSITSNNRVFGNYLGLAADGNTPLGNESNNIQIENSPNNRIGGLTADSANVISASINDHGILLTGPSTTGNSIVGNLIGTNAAGDQALGNLWQGVAINNDAAYNVIGPGNLISGNSGFGIKIEAGTPHHNKILSNLIGTTANGEQLLSNRDDGVHIHNSYGNAIDGNIICGAGIGSVGNNGIEIYGIDAHSNTILNNYIGTNAASGVNLGNGFNGVHIAREAHHNSVGPNNFICSNYGSGIRIDSEETVSADSNLVFQNYIGTDLNGNTDLGNGAHGIEIRGNSKITTIGPNNIIAGNTYDGIHLENAGTTGTVIFQNIIGTNTLNSSEIGNGSMGILLDDSVKNTTIGPGNVVSGNGMVGIELLNGSSDNTLIGNRVGTTINGMDALGNEGIGVMILDSPNNLIGGTEPEDRNLLSGNGMEGLAITFAGSSGNRVIGNYIGTDATGQGLLQNGSGDFGINAAPNNMIGGLNPGERNVIASMAIGNSGANWNNVVGNFIGIRADGTGPLSEVYYGAGVFIGETSDNTIGPGNVISGLDHGVYIHVRPGGEPDSTARNKIIGNYIGTNPDGSSEIPNRVGIFIEGATSTAIGGISYGERNIISGSKDFGIQLDGPATDTHIENNYIGTDKDGTQQIPNREGISIGPNSYNNYIGNGTYEGRNLIAFNTSAGIGLGGEENYVLGNWIHDVQTWGIYVVGNNNVIGGALEESGNYIWGENNGIQIFPDIEGTRIEGNVLGTDLEGKEDMTEGWNGIAMSGLNTIIKDNVICGFEHHGIHLPRWDDNSTIPSGNQITGNIIGLAPNGENFIPNGHGISLNSASDNIISENIIAGNQNHGITINDNIGAQSQGNLISQNNIYSNGGIGIDLLSDWVTENDIDPLDPDEGPNHLQNFPVLDSISFGEGKVTVGGYLRTKSDSTYIIEFFSSNIADDLGYGEGEFYLGSDTVITNDTGYVDFVVTLSTKGYGAQVITATATDEEGNTSEFSLAIGGVINQVLAEMPFYYTLNSEGLSTVPLADYQNAIHSAFQTWNTIATAEIEMEYAGSSDEKYASATDEINLISFQDDHFPFPKGVLAITAKTLKISAGGTKAEILDADIIFNPAYIIHQDHSFAILDEGDTVSKAFDIQSVATHEIGHVLGMIHSGVYSSTMFFMLGYGTTERELGADDMAWASYRYPNGDFQPNHGMISGRVTYGDLGDPAVPSSHPPVAGALVLAIDTLTQEMFHAYTDADGNYTIPIYMDGTSSGLYWIYIQPLDGDVWGTALYPSNISPYIYSHTMFTDFPEEFYDDYESSIDTARHGDYIAVSAGGSVTGVDLITNRDQTPPTVLGVFPADGDTGIAVSPTLVLKFSEPVDIYSFDENSCFLENSGEIVEGDFTILADSTHIMLMTPLEALQYSTSYTLHIDGITDLKDNALETPYTSSFTTQAPDTIAPYVYDVIPADSAVQVDVTKPIKIFFSEAMNKNSAESGVMLMTSDSALVEGSFEWDPGNTKMTCIPDYSLLEGTAYIISLSTQVSDLSGNAMENDTSLTFSTVDVAAPQILYMGPEDGKSGITVSTPIVVKFSEPLDVSTITSTSFSLTGIAGQVNGAFEYLDDDRTIVFRPEQDLQFNESYTINLSSDISDISSPKQYLEDTIAIFQTAAAKLVPHITYMDPPFGAIGAQTTIVGSGFDPVPWNNAVSFNGVPATVSKSTLESVTVLVPVNAFSGPVSVTVNGEPADNTFVFDVVPPNTDPSYSVIASANTGSRTRSVVINPEAAFAYVTNWGDNTVTAIDISAYVPVPVINIQVGVEPMDIDLNPNGTLAYVTNFLSNTVSVIGTDQGVDSTYHKVTKNIPVGYHPYGVAVSSDKKVYVANNESEYVSVIDVDPSSGGFDHVIANVKTGSTNRSIVVTPNAGLILVTGENGVAIIDRDPGSPTFNDVIARASAGSTTRDVEITPEAALALATTEDGVILIIDIYQPPGTQFGNVIASVKTGSSARNITMSPDAQYVYITNPDDNTVSVYRLDYSIIPGYGASLNNPLGLEHITTIQVADKPYAIASHPSYDYLLVTHDSDEGGVSKIAVEEESVDAIYTLDQLIASVENALEDGRIPVKYGARLLEDLQIVKVRIENGKLASALDNINVFIKRLQRYMSRGGVPEDLGNAWLEAAYRIRDQLLRDMEAQESQLKGSGEAGSEAGAEAGVLDDPQNLEKRDLTDITGLKLENRPNPFSDHTQVHFEIPDKGQSDVPVLMRVYNINGQVVKTLVHQNMSPGRYTLLWNSDLDDGGQVSDGIYLLELRTNEDRETIRISVVK